jgi:Ca2+-binding EF-hand superfamily protein
MALHLLFAAAVAAAQPTQTPPPAAPDREVAGRPGRPFMSPMGEPFLGRATGEDGLTVWFKQADKNHDGSITQDEITADAQRFFETLDTNHDGEIDPDETTHYEQVIAPEVRTGLIDSAGGDQQSGRAAYRGGGGHREGRHGNGDISSAFSGADDEARAGRFGLLQIPEPITSADADFDRGVSAIEFRNAAVQRFQLLDANRTGRLTFPELESIRETAISASKRRSPDKSSPDEARPLDPDGDTQGAIPQM